MNVQAEGRVSIVALRGSLTAILLACVLCDLPARAGEPNPCSKLKFRYVEIIESQGFLGLATPDPDPKIVKRALDGEIAQDRWLYNLNRDIPSLADWDEYDRSRMQLGELCSIVNRFKDWGMPVRTLSVVCRADSRESYSSDDLSRSSGEVSGDCYLSTYGGTSTDPERFAAYRLKHASGGFADLLLHPGDESRYDVIADPERRKRLYAIAIRQAVEGFVYAESWDLFPFDCWAVKAWESTMDWNPRYRCRPPDPPKHSRREGHPDPEPSACRRGGDSDGDPTGLTRRLERELGS